MYKSLRGLGALIASGTLTIGLLATTTTVVATASAETTEPSRFVGVGYQRLMSTKDPGQEAFGPSEVRTVKVEGTGRVPSTGVEAVVLDVTVLNATAFTTVQVWKTGTTPPSNAIVRATNETVPIGNTIIVEPDDLGRVSVQNHAGTTHLNIDVQGYFTAGDGSGFHALRQQIVDSTGSLGYSGPLGNNASAGIQVSGSNVPANATAIYANVAALSPSDDGSLTFYPRGGIVPAAKSVNYSGGAGDFTGLTIPLDADGGFALKNEIKSGTVGLRIEVQGYFTPAGSSSEGLFTVLPQKPLLGVDGVTIPAGGTREIAVGGQNGLPLYGVEGAVFNINTFAWQAAGQLRVWPKGGTEPTAGQISFAGAESGPGGIAMTTVVPPGIDGKIVVKNTSTQSTGVTLALQGWFGGYRVIPTADEAVFVQNSVDLGIPEGIARLAVWNQALADMMPQEVEIAEETSAEVELETYPMTSDSPEDAARTADPQDGAYVTVTEAPADQGQEPDTHQRAEDGTCAGDGFKLYQGHEKRKVKNNLGMTLYIVGLKKRWCAKRSVGRIGSWWAKQWGDVSSWADPLVEDLGTDPDWEYDDVFLKADGVHGRSGHLSTRVRSFKTCSGWPQIFCWKTHWLQGFNAWWDGGRISWSTSKGF